MDTEYKWLADQGLGRILEFLTALGIGLLIGLERERSPTAKAGLRTFALVALFGAASAVLAEKLDSPALVAAGALVEQGAKIPDRSFVVGVPGKVRGEPSAELLARLKKGVAVYRELTTRYKQQGL